MSGNGDRFDERKYFITILFYLTFL